MVVNGLRVMYDRDNPLCQCLRITFFSAIYFGSIPKHSETLTKWTKKLKSVNFVKVLEQKY